MSQRVYCLAQFTAKSGKEAELFKLLQSLEPNTLREDGCLWYRVTRHIESQFAEGTSPPLVFFECWRDMTSFEAHCRRSEIQQFFAEQTAPDGLVASSNVCVYSDEPQQYDSPRY